MATRGKVQAMTATSTDVLNAIRNGASQNYKDYVPYATPDAESIKTIGNIIMQYPALQNEFLTALINRIGRVIMTSKMYSNPWNAFKKGLLEFGETIEEIFVQMASPYQYDPEVAETNYMKRDIPDVRAAFHVMNYQKFYKKTIQEKNLRQAFLSWDGVNSLVAGIVNSMYTGAAYDEFLTMKYLLAKHIMEGHLYPEAVPVVDGETGAKSLVTSILGISNVLPISNSNLYNIAGVNNFTLKEDQYLIVSGRMSAMLNVDVLAAAFNMDKVTFMGHVVTIDSFGSLDIKRLNELFSGDPNYTEPSQDELNMLDSTVAAVLIDRDFFQIYDNLAEFTENFNGEGIYWQYYYHVWKTFSISPFANAIVFTQQTPAVNTVSVAPSAITLPAGGTATLAASVETVGYAPKSVAWSSSSEEITVDMSGKVTVKEGTASSTTATITATSTYDSSKTGTSTITVG